MAKVKTKYSENTLKLLDLAGYFLKNHFSSTPQIEHTRKTKVLQESNSKSYISLQVSFGSSLPRWDVGPSLSQENTLEEEMATPSSILAWEIPWTE